MRLVEVPPPFQGDKNPFLPPGFLRDHNYWDLDVDAYKKPTWWSDYHGWVSFLQTQDTEFDSSLLFSCLKYPASHYVSESSEDGNILESKTGYSLAPTERENWQRLDYQLCNASKELLGEFGISCFAPLQPLVMGYLRLHKRHGAFLRCLQKSRQWFKLHLGLLSYLIAASTTLTQLEPQEYPLPLPGCETNDWQGVLLSSGQSVGLDQCWLDLLLQSTVTHYDVERTGVFLDLEVQAKTPHHLRQPDPTWFCQYNIPVWYPWTAKHNKNEQWADLAPPTHQIQVATTFLSKSPISPLINLEPTDSIEDPLPVVSERSGSTTQMDEFFRLREERNKRIEAKENDSDRHLRLNLERQRPTKKTRMFLWTKNNHGEYERTLVSRKDQASYFDDDSLYSDEQMRYDSFHNEWHVCDLWGPDRIDEDWNAFYAGDFSTEDVIPQLPETNYSGIELEGDDLVNTIGKEVEDERSCQVPPTLADKLESEIIHSLSTYFGYTASIPPSNWPIVGEEGHRKKILRWLGIEWNLVQNVHHVFERPAVAAAIHFLECLATSKLDNSFVDEWDLFPDNCRSIVHTERFRSFRQVSSEDKIPLFLLDLKEQRQAPWFLALKHGADVAVVCRLEKKWTEYDIVEFLLQRGIPFHTLLPSSSALRTPIISRPSLVPPYRMKSHEFVINDYCSYRARCNSILQHPRGRAALMHGGLMWRLAVTVVPWEDVYRGPCGWSSNPNEMIVVMDPVLQLELLDDRLTTVEQEALCGTYLCRTGKFFFDRLFLYFTRLAEQANSDQVSISSWYMPPQIFPRCAQDMGRWTGYSEKVFQLIDRLDSSDPSDNQGQHVLRKTCKPRPRKDWKKQARDSGNRRALVHIDRQVEALLSRD